MKPTVALRMDDVGASSKRYEVYSNWRAGFGPVRVSGNWLFLKYVRPFRAWGPYDELSAETWERICERLDRARARMTVAVTAAWAEREDRVVPFPERFPRQATVLKQAVSAGLIEIANHGLTHCVLAGNQFHPRWFASNRSSHREFWDWVPEAVQAAHLQQSQAILQACFNVDVVTFVPPGNVFTARTLELARATGLRYVSCATDPNPHAPLTVIGNSGVDAFHDREVALEGLAWLDRRLQGHAGKEFCFVRELAERAEWKTARPS